MTILAAIVIRGRSKLPAVNNEAANNVEVLKITFLVEFHAQMHQNGSLVYLLGPQISEIADKKTENY